MVCALSSTTLTSTPSGSGLPTSCSMVPLGSSSSLCLKDSSSRLLCTRSLRSSSARPLPPADASRHGPFSFLSGPEVSAPRKAPGPVLHGPLLRARGTPTLSERSASLRHNFRWPDPEGRRFEEDVDTARAAGQGAGAPQLCGLEPYGPGGRRARR